MIEGVDADTNWCLLSNSVNSVRSKCRRKAPKSHDMGHDYFQEVRCKTVPNFAALIGEEVE